MSDPPRSNPTGQPNPADIILAMQESSFAGPLPPPELLRGYEEVSPGAAQRIIGMAETQSAHRREIEQRMSNAAVEEMRRQFSENRIGQLCAVSVSVAFLIAGVYVALAGHPWPGAVIGGVGGGGIGLPAIVTAFLRRGEPTNKSEPPANTQATQTPRRRRR